jgi:hypothetical protein
VGAASDFVASVGGATGTSINPPSLIRRPIRAEYHNGGRSQPSNHRRSADRKLQPRISGNREVQVWPVAADLKP